jgi:uncharacterized protein YjbI with pentapeptide repeats
VADEKLLAILKQGAAAWNEWRTKNLDIESLNLRWAKLRNVNLRGANLSSVQLLKAELDGADLSRADIRRADLVGANLRSANLTEAQFHHTKLMGANLDEANLYEAHLFKADLSAAILSGANLIWANLREANLTEANLRSANLFGANLDGVILDGARLIMANLSQANLGGTSLRGADLTDARMEFTGLSNLNLSMVKGLESVKHTWPSSIGIDTIYRSKGKIPEVFLRGAGVPEPFIVQMKALVGAMEPIQFYSCFISYSSKDQEFAERLHADLQSKGVRCWFAPEDLKIGDRFQERIEESIRLFDKVMIVLSEASVQSRWVEREVNAAREREDRENRTVLFPIRIDDTVMMAPQPWASDVRRTRHIGDFEQWHQHPSYRKAFDRLVSDLKASEEPRADRS